MPRYNYPGYSPTSHPFMEERPNSKGKRHGGADTPAAAGTPVYAEHDGKVFRSGEIYGYGKAVVVKSTAPNGTPFYELYGHLGPDPLPQPGEQVYAGKQIPGAFIGSEKYVNSFKGADIKGSHLHREIIWGGKGLELHDTEKFGVQSSDFQWRADPDTFDINNPVFPYMRGAVPLPRPRPNIPEPSAAPSGENPRAPSDAARDENWAAPFLNPTPFTSGGPGRFSTDSPLFRDGRLQQLYPTDKFVAPAPNDTFNDRFYFDTNPSSAPPGRGRELPPAPPSPSPLIDQPAKSPFNPYRLQPFPQQLLPPSTSGSTTRASMPGDPNTETPLARLLRLTARETAGETAREPDGDADPSAAPASDRVPVRFADPLATLAALVRLSGMQDGTG